MADRRKKTLGRRNRTAPNANIEAMSVPMCFGVDEVKNRAIQLLVIPVKTTPATMP